MATSVQLVLIRDVRASQPAATAVVAGTLFCVEDEAYIVEQSNGTAWEPWGQAGAGVLAFVTADPGAPANGQAWIKYSGGTLTLNIRSGGVTKSAPIAVI